MTEPSLDLFYRITPAITGSLTINTDFSATEVDDRQVNLTRFNLFFPEKRDFFLADADLFEFARFGSAYPPGIRTVTTAGQQNGRPFFSRRIGLSAQGTPVDIDYGGKLSGRVGRYTFGAMGIRQDEFVPTTGAGGRSQFAVRRAHDHGRALAVQPWALLRRPAIRRATSIIRWSVPIFSTTTIDCRGARPVLGEVWYQQTETENRDGDDAAMGFGLRIPASTGLRGAFNYKQIGRNFFPAMGFVSRVGIEDKWAGMGYVWRFDDSVLLSTNTEVDGLQVSSLDTGQRLTEVSRFAPGDGDTGTRPAQTVPAGYQGPFARAVCHLQHARQAGRDSSRRLPLRANTASISKRVLSVRSRSS